MNNDATLKGTEIHKIVNELKELKDELINIKEDLIKLDKAIRKTAFNFMINCFIFVLLSYALSF